MATVTLAANNPTLQDWKSALGPDNRVARMINVLEKTNEIVFDMTFIEGNEATGHMFVMANGLPTTAMRMINDRIKPTKGTTVQMREGVGFLEAYHNIDARLVMLNGDGAQYRLNQATLQIESMTQTLANQIFYGNRNDDPREIAGLSVRYSSKSAQNGKNIIDAGGTGSDNRSIWLINWGEMACFGFVPKGSPAGLQMEDLGKTTSETSDGLMEVYRTHFVWDYGLGLADWRYVARVANIDVSDLTDDASSGANLPILMKKAMRRTPRNQLMRPAFYMSGDMLGYVETQLAAAVKSSTLTVEDVGGVRTTMFAGVPIRQVEELDVDEARVT